MQQRNLTSSFNIYRYGERPTHRANICSWNICGSFPWYITGILGKNFPMKFCRTFPEECSGNIESRNVPWMFHEYPTYVICIFLGGSRNTIVDEAVPDIRWVSLKI